MEKKVSVVVPVFNEAESIIVLHQELTKVLAQVPCEGYEFIFVDDGSRDRSFAMLEQLHAEDDHVRVIQFRRNFGKSAALAAGFRVASGDVVFTLDGDLQDNPAEIPHFLDMLDTGYDLVSGWKYPRYDPLTKTLPSSVFNFVTRAMTGVKLHDFNCGFKAYSYPVTQEIRLYGELHRYTPILAHYKGFCVGEIKVSHRPRKFGRSKYGFKRFARGFFDLLTVLFLGQYTWRPLHLFGWAGLIALVLGILVNLYLTVLWFQGRGPIGDRPLLTLGVLLITVGIQFFSFGLLTEMFAFTQSRDSEPYSIRRELE